MNFLREEVTVENSPKNLQLGQYEVLELQCSGKSLRKKLGLGYVLILILKLCMQF